MNFGRVEEFGATLAGARKVGVMKDPTERFIRVFRGDRACGQTDAPVRHRHTRSKSKELQRVTAHEKEPRFT